MIESTVVSVVIVNWNVRKLVVNCLRSLIARNPSLILDISVIDNNSSDGSGELIRREFPQIKLIQNLENVGFSRANNQGIREAQGQYILLLNPDTLWVDDSLQRMVEYMNSHPEVGVLGPKLLNADAQSIQYWGARRLPRPLDTFFEYSKLSSIFPRNRLFGRHLMGNWNHTDSREVECLSGACMLIRQQTLQEVGLLDENYPLYTEDTDWCYRVHLTNWKMYYFAEARLIHIGQQSSLQNRGKATINAVRGIYRYHRKFYGVAALLMVWFLVWITSIAKIFGWAALFLIRANGRELALKQMKTYWNVCCLLPTAGIN